MQRTEFIEINLLDIIRILRENILIILIVGLIGAGLFGGYNLTLANPVYQSTSKIYVLTQSTSITSFADIQLSSSLAKDYEKMILSRPVVNQVKKKLKLDYSYDTIISSKISVMNPTDTRVLEITCKSNDAKEAADMANEFALVAKRQIANIMKTDEPTIFEKAVISSSPISPQIGRNILIGFILGLIFSIIFVILLDMFNNYIRTESDVERYLKLNVLSSIPNEPLMDEEK